MSKSRLINTKFWDDSYTSNLDPIEKLLFLYFLTNTSTNICGIYEIPLKKIAVETGIDKEMVEKIIKRFEKDNKVVYRDGWVGIINFIKNQNQTSPMVIKGIERELELVPDNIRKLVLEGIDTLSHLTKPNLTKPNLTKPNAKSAKDKFSQDGADIIKAFEDVDKKNKLYYGNTSQRSAADFLIETYGKEKVLSAISILNRTNEMTYAPKITTPVQLRDKWVNLITFAAKKMGEQNQLLEDLKNL